MSQTALPDTASPDSVSPDTVSPDTPPMRPQVLQAIENLLPKVLGRPAAPVREEAQLFEEVGLDSATTLELILELEDALEVQIDVERISQDDLASFGTLVDFLAGHVVQE